MPLTRISIPAHLAQDKALALAGAVHEALVSTCDVHPKDRFQLVSRFAARDMMVDPTFGDVDRSADAAIVEIIFLAGRSEDTKRSLYRTIVAAAATAGFRSDDVMVTLVENSPIDWSLGRGEAYDGHGFA